MRIDPSKLSEPLAHVLGAGAADAAGGQKAAAAGAGSSTSAGSIDRLDVMLLRRLRAGSVSDAASSVVSFHDAKERAERVAQQAASDPAVASEAQGTLDPNRVRGLLD